MNKKLYKLMNWADIEEIIYSESDHPQSLLGVRPCTGGSLVQCFFPGATSVSIKWVPSTPLATETVTEMENADEEGYFAVILPDKKVSYYTYIVNYEKVNEDKTIDIKTVTCGDPYRHSQVIDKKSLASFLDGSSKDAYKFMGAHVFEHQGEIGTLFAVWAPNAMRISVIGEFNNWDGRAHQMKRLDGGVFEIFIPGNHDGEKYQYEIKLKGDKILKRNDPFTSRIVDNLSVVYAEDKYNWKDSEFCFGKKKQTNPLVYELSNSWLFNSKKKPAQIAKDVAKYVVEQGYNVVAINPFVPANSLDNVCEYFYAVNDSYVDAITLKSIVDIFHANNLQVFFSYSISGFSRNDLALSNFDGTCLYEHMDPRQGLSADGKKALFQFGRSEVISFLRSNALYLVKEFHADGIIMSQVAQLLYLDYGKVDGSWIPNNQGTNENLEAISLIKDIIGEVRKSDNNICIMAEDSSTHGGMTVSSENGGMDFDYKWNEGFLGEFFDYMSYDPIERKYHHNQLTNEHVYAFTEKYIIPLSNQLMCQNSGVLDLFPGNEEMRKRSLRLSVAYSYFHEGNKLVGEEIDKACDKLCKELNSIYKTEPALCRTNNEPQSFEWLSNMNAEGCYISFVRKTDDPEEMLIAIANFAGVEQKITTGVPYEGKYKEILNTDDVVFGGSGNLNKNVKKAIDIPSDGRAQSIDIVLAPLSISLLKFIPYTETELAKVIEERIRRNTPIKKSKKAGK